MMKKRYHLVQVTGEAPRSYKFYPRLVYSALTRCRGRQSTVTKLHRSVGLSRDAVAKARDTLVTLGLATVARGKITALKPVGMYEAEGVTNESDRSTWFYYLKGEPIWWRAFQYLKFHSPSDSCPLDHRGCAVLGYIGYRARATTEAKKLTYGYVGARIGIDYRTVAKVLVALNDAGFIEHVRRADRDVFSVRVVDPMARPDWFLDKTVATDLAPKKPRVAEKVAPKEFGEIDFGDCSYFDIIYQLDTGDYDPGEYGGWYPNIDLEMEFSDDAKSGNLRAGRPDVAADRGGGPTDFEGLLHPGEVAVRPDSPLDFGAVIEVGPGHDGLDMIYGVDEVQPYAEGGQDATRHWEYDEKLLVEFLKSM